MPNRSCSRRSYKRERGIVLIFALVTLVIMLIGAVAISRSLSSNQFAIGNIGFKRDMTHQTERAVQAAMAAFRASGALANVNLRNANLPAANYSATLLPTNAQGIPLALLSDSTFNTVGEAGNDIALADVGLTIRYVVDRISSAPGVCSVSTCSMVNDVIYGGAVTELISAQNNSSAANSANPSAVTPQPVYRVTMRVKGPRNTLSFFQSTFTSN